VKQASLSRGKTIWNYILLHAHNPEGAHKAEDKMPEITGKLLDQYL